MNTRTNEHYARSSTYNELVELFGHYFITKSSGFDEAVISVFDPYFKDSKTDELSHTYES